MPKRETRAGKRTSKNEKVENGANLGFEAKLWLAADKLRNNMDAAEYKHVVLGLIFLKYISDAFEEKHAALAADRKAGADPEDPDEYRAENIFWVPKEARWSHLQGNAKQPTIGKLVDDAMVAIERDNPTLKGVLPKDYARPALDKQRLGELIDLIGTIGLGDKANRSKDILGRVYEYFLAKFAAAEGKKGGQFYTPRCVVRVLVEMLAPYKGRVFDPCCGSGGMFVQSEKFVEAHGGRIGDIAIYGQESNPTTWRLAKMNLAIRGIDAQPRRRTRRHLPPRPAQGPQGRLRPRQPAVQRQRLGRRAPARGRALEVRRAAGGQRQLRLGAALRPPPRAHRARGLRARQRLDVLAAVGRGRDPQGARRGRPGRLHGRPARPALLLDADPGLPVVPVARQEERPRRSRQEDAEPPARDALHRRPQAGHADRPRPPRTDRRGHRADRRHLPRLARREGAGKYEDVPGFCKCATTEEIAATSTC